MLISNPGRLMQTGTVPEAIDDEKWEAIPFPCKQGDGQYVKSNIIDNILSKLAMQITVWYTFVQRCF
jgi:hypothetical protein